MAFLKENKEDVPILKQRVDQFRGLWDKIMGEGGLGLLGGEFAYKHYMESDDPIKKATIQPIIRAMEEFGPKAHNIIFPFGAKAHDSINSLISKWETSKMYKKIYWRDF